MRTRLATAPAAAVIDHVNRPAIERDTAHAWSFMTRAHLAHAVMLTRTGIVTPDTGRVLVTELARLASSDPATLAFDPGLEDVYFNIEQHVGERVGVDAAGWLQTGRSRNDHLAGVARMWTRSVALDVLTELNALRHELLTTARQHIGTVMTGYTHQQPGQPITFGYYLVAVATALARDAERIRDAWSRINSSPFGSGSMAGVSWPIDRTRIATLLGFEDITTNALDSVASRDPTFELTATLAILTTTISRVAADLQLFVSWEHGTMVVSDDVAAVSSIMPQKKNPVTLEHCKGAAAQVLGGFVAMMASAKSAPFSHQRETSSEAMRPFSEVTTQTIKAMSLMRSTISGLVVDIERLEANAAANFSTATDIADMLVRSYGIPFRKAHSLVGTAVREAIDHGVGVEWFESQAFADAVHEVAGGDKPDASARPRLAVDPRSSVEARAVAGGPARASLEDQLMEAGITLSGDQRWCDERRAALDEADHRLFTNARSIAEGSEDQT